MIEAIKRPPRASRPARRRWTSAVTVSQDESAHHDLRLARHCATWAFTNAFRLVEHLSAIGKVGEAAAAANTAGTLEGVLREFATNLEGWRPATPNVRVVP